MAVKGGFPLATKIARKRLPDMLLEQGLVTEEQLEECISLHRSTGQTLAHLLVQKGYLGEEDLVVTLSEQFSASRNAKSVTVPVEDRETRRKTVEQGIALAG